MEVDAVEMDRDLPLLGSKRAMLDPLETIRVLGDRRQTVLRGWLQILEIDAPPFRDVRLPLEADEAARLAAAISVGWIGADLEQHGCVHRRVNEHTGGGTVWEHVDCLNARPCTPKVELDRH